MRDEINHKLEVNFKFIKRINFFFTWTNERVEKLIKAIGELQFKPREAVWQQGDSSDTIYIVKSGVLFMESIIEKDDVNYFPIESHKW